jgi:hypothetical protein
VTEGKNIQKTHPNFGLYEICDNQPFRHKGTVVVHSYNQSVLAIEREKNATTGILPLQPLKFVYFTESDQIVRFDSFFTMHALMQVL